MTQNRHDCRSRRSHDGLRRWSMDAAARYEAGDSRAATELVAVFPTGERSVDAPHNDNVYKSNHRLPALQWLLPLSFCVVPLEASRPTTRGSLTRRCRATAPARKPELN